MKGLAGTITLFVSRSRGIGASIVWKLVTIVLKPIAIRVSKSGITPKMLTQIPFIEYLKEWVEDLVASDPDHELYEYYKLYGR